MQYAPTRTIQSLPGIGFNKYVFIRNLSRTCRGVLHTTRNVSDGSIICPWSWIFVGRIAYILTQTIQSLSGIRFNKYVFIRYLSHTGQFVLHTPQHVPGELIIYPWSWAFVGRMQYDPTRIIQFLTGIWFNKYVFIRHLSGIDRGVLHTARNVQCLRFIVQMAIKFLIRTSRGV